MWKFYQSAIIKKIFVPYVAYLMILLILSGITVRQYGEMFDGDDICPIDDNGNQMACRSELYQKNNFWWISMESALLTFSAIILLVYFVSLEFS